MLCWAWLHNLIQTDQVGLIKLDGTERLAYQVWKALAHPSYMRVRKPFCLLSFDCFAIEVFDDAVSFQMFLTFNADLLWVELDTIKWFLPVFNRFDFA